MANLTCGSLIFSAVPLPVLPLQDPLGINTLLLTQARLRLSHCASDSDGTVLRVNYASVYHIKVVVFLFNSWGGLSSTSLLRLTNSTRNNRFHSVFIRFLNDPVHDYASEIFASDFFVALQSTFTNNNPIVDAPHSATMKTWRWFGVVQVLKSIHHQFKSICTS